LLGKCVNLQRIHTSNSGENACAVTRRRVLANDKVTPTSPLQELESVLNNEPIEISRNDKMRYGLRGRTAEYSDAPTPSIPPNKRVHDELLEPAGHDEKTPGEQTSKEKGKMRKGRALNGESLAEYADIYIYINQNQQVTMWDSTGLRPDPCWRCETSGKSVCIAYTRQIGGYFE
jgi:hypothetical protein